MSLFCVLLGVMLWCATCDWWFFVPTVSRDTLVIMGSVYVCCGLALSAIERSR